jgi:acetyl-CoA acyltransferase
MDVNHAIDVHVADPDLRGIMADRKNVRRHDEAHDAVIVAGNRTPFLKSNGAYKNLMAHDLGRHAVTGLLQRTGLDPQAVEQVVMGTVVSDPRTSNVAREISLGAGIPNTAVAYTTTQAIRGGHVGVAIVGGTETFSDPPIRLSKHLRQALSRLQKAKGPNDYFKVPKDLGPKDLVPDIPSPAEFSTGLTMGQSCERMGKAWGVTREEADELAARSHVLAHRAWEEGRFADEVTPVQAPPRFDAVERDDGPRGDTTVDVLAKLKPAFDREFGTVTAGSSSFLTDGASSVLMMSRAKAEELGMDALSVIADYVYAATDPLDELLLGPALTIPVLLARNGLKTEDVGVWEIHEAFSAQMVANMKALDDGNLARERLGMSKPVGRPPLEQTNVWGGSLSLGHPFGATGGRLLTTASRRLQLEGKRYAVIAGCAAGGQGSAILLENATGKGA